jgi:tRNA1Val (adenine37-N6)-methyltransferase
MTINNNIHHLKKLGKESSTFFFKQFKVEDGRSTMKVGTDAVLLGAVADVGNSRQVLEIGTGCGVIALMLAQRSDAVIDAVEIDEESAGQATENAKNSPWKNRISIIHSSLQDFTKQAAKKYDIIISNPPYFSGSLKSANTKRNLSRHDEMLSLYELLSCVQELMSGDASLWLILPVKESSQLIKKALETGFSVHYILKIMTKSGCAPERFILLLKKSIPEKTVEEILVIKNDDGLYTKEYKELTKDYYIDF